MDIIVLQNYPTPRPSPTRGEGTFPTLYPPLRGGRGIGVKLRNSWDGMDCRDALTGSLYVCPCLLVIHKSTKAYRKMWQATVPRWRGIKGVDGHK